MCDSTILLHHIGAIHSLCNQALVQFGAWSALCWCIYFRHDYFQTIESTTETLVELGDLAGYKQDFLNLFGFGFEGVDYEADTNEMVMVPSIK